MVLVIDNYDSFTFNLVQYLGLCEVEPIIYRNDEISLDAIIALQPEGIILSPGPCTPAESGICRDISAEILQKESRLSGVSTLGVCLGHQTIAEIAGGVVRKAKTIKHGKSSQIEHDGHGIFQDIPNPLHVIRYHSLSVEEEGLPSCLTVTSRSCDDGEVMSFRHKELPIEGVQFHPESIQTDHGIRMIENFVAGLKTR